MKARLRKLFNDLRESFWMVPALMVLLGIGTAFGLITLDRSDLVPKALLETDWIYSGGSTGARTLLGAIASSAIGVAGTVFSITIAALSLAAGQMGPRLLKNFTRDRGNQVTLGAFLGTFAYALVVLRSVRVPDEGAFVPHIALSVGMLFALACVAVLVYFVGHMAGRINVDTVVELVFGDVQAAIRKLAVEDAQPEVPPLDFWKDAVPIANARRGYLHALDADSLAAWAAEHRTAIRLFVRHGDYIYPGAPIGLIRVPVEGADAAVRNAVALGATRGSLGDAEHAIRQLVEVAVRALSPGINDPHTAMGVLDRLGSSLCELAGRHLPSGVHLRDDGEVALVVPSPNYETLTNIMFHMIRQNAVGSAAVYIHMLEVLTAVASCERDPARRKVLSRQAGLVMVSARKGVAAAGDLADIRRSSDIFDAMMRHGPSGAFLDATGGIARRA